MARTDGFSYSENVVTERSTGILFRIFFFSFVTVFVSACGPAIRGSIPTNTVTVVDYVNDPIWGEALNSNACRDPAITPVPQLSGQTISSAITAEAEVTTFGGTGSSPNLPVSGGYNYRDIPDATKDDDDYLGTTCAYAARPVNDCGTGQTTVDLRVADCALQNPTSSIWNGATQCNFGQGTWNLVTRDGANKEVWRDTRTGLIWSSMVGTVNWCEASGNTQAAPVTFLEAYNTGVGTEIVGSGTIGTIGGGSSSLTETVTITFSNATTFAVSGTGGAGGCQGGAITAGALTATAGSRVTWSAAGICSFTLTQGAINFINNDKFTLASTAAATYSCVPGSSSTLQPASPMSYCAEAGGAFTSYPAGENWATGIYMPAKGLMGANSTPRVMWRLPTIQDYNQAEVDGVRMVLPDMGIIGTSRLYVDGSAGGNNFEWSASMESSNRIGAWYFRSLNGAKSFVGRSSSALTRCVGR